MARKIEKAANAYRSISEVAEIIGVETHVLRFWETKFSQIKPMKRDRGRRYYRAEDVRILHTIRDLLRVHGYTIKGVQNLLRKFRVADIYQGAEHILSAGGLSRQRLSGGIEKGTSAMGPEGIKSPNSQYEADLADLVSHCMTELRDAKALLTPS